MAYAIFRAEKIKSWGLLARASGHMNRTLPTPNADPTRANLVLIGSGDAAHDVRAHLAGAGLAAEGLRKNGVLAVRILATASPEFFRPGRVHRAGEWDADRLDAWQPAAMAFLKQEFGDNLVSAILHLDESTPHIDAVFVPLDKTPRNKGSPVRLNCARWFDGRKKLVELQDSYAAALASLGLKRGVRGSRAHHQDIKRQYATLHFEAEAARETSELATLTLADAVLERRQAKAERETAKSEREAVRTERERAEALAFGLEAFADGRIRRATGDEVRPRFELRPMPKAEAETLKRRIQPAWRDLWHAVRRLTLAFEKRAGEVARAAAARAREAALTSLSETIKTARVIAARAARLSNHLPTEAHAEAQFLNALLKKEAREPDKGARDRAR